MNDYIVLRNGKRIEVPREVEAKGGAAVEAHVLEQALPKVLELNVPQLEKEIEQIQFPEDLDRVHAIERAHPEFTGGRAGVFEAIENRREELAQEAEERAKQAEKADTT